MGRNDGPATDGLARHDGPVYTAKFTPDGKRIVMISCETVVDYINCTEITARVWDAAKGQELAVLHIQDGRVAGAQFSPDGQRIVTASCEKVDVRDTCLGGIARVWDVMAGQQPTTLGGREGRVSGAQFSPDGQRIVTASDDKTARVWNAMTGQQLHVLGGHEGRVSSAQFSPDGQRIVTVSDRTVRVWDSGTGKLVAVLLHRGYVSSAQFSPDGQQIVTSGCETVDAGRDCAEGTARVWKAETGQELAVLRGHEGQVSTRSFRRTVSRSSQRVMIGPRECGGRRRARNWPS